MDWDLSFIALIGDQFAADGDVTEMYDFNVFIRDGDQVLRT